MTFICTKVYISFFSALKKVKTEGASTRIKPIKPIDLLPSEKNKFFRYRGSFTTPKMACAESVVWSVFKEPLKISYHQLKRFWELRTTTAGVEEHLIENFRLIFFRKFLLVAIVSKNLTDFSSQQYVLPSRFFLFKLFDKMV